MKNIYDYYMKDLISKVKLHHSKWSIEDVFNYKPLLEHFYDKTFKNEEVYPQDQPIIKNIKTAFRLGGKGIASKPSNFKLETVVNVIKKYAINDNYYDSSCGWGVRMIGSCACGKNYYGTDPNYELTSKLNEIADLFFEVDLFAPIVSIKTQGSETFIPEWENKMGLAFTSPPYFLLEDYKVGEQSTKLYGNYNDWLEKFLRPTFENTYRYLIDNAYMIINIKDYDKFDLEQQTIELAKQVGFEFIGKEDFNNIQRIKSTGELMDNSEDMFVFKKTRRD